MIDRASLSYDGRSPLIPNSGGLGAVGQGFEDS
jgi:hypothetical protein